jgi:hypothetical protein
MSHVERDVDSYVAIKVLQQRRFVGAFTLLCAYDSELKAMIRSKKSTRSPFFCAICGTAVGPSLQKGLPRASRPFL